MVILMRKPKFPKENNRKLRLKFKTLCIFLIA